MTFRPCQHDSANNLLPNSSSYSITGATFTIPSLKNDNVVDLGGTIAIQNRATLTSASGCIITNGSRLSGGGMFTYGGSMILSNCVISGNVASGGGGLMGDGFTSSHIFYPPSVSCTGCEIVDNTGSSAYAGGIRMNNGTLFLNDCIVSNNHGNGAGKGIMCTGGTTTLSNTTVIGNTDQNGNIALGTAEIYQSQGILNIAGGCTVGYVTVNGQALEDAAAQPTGSMILNGSNTFLSSSWLNSTGACYISGGAVITLGSYIQTQTANRIFVSTGGCTVNGHYISAGSYTKINSDGTTT